MADCKEKIITIINKVADKTIQFDDLSDSPLTGDDIGLTDYQMVYMVLEIMQEFNIRFNADDFVYYKFATLDSVVDIVNTKLTCL